MHQLLTKLQAFYKANKTDQRQIIALGMCDKVKKLGEIAYAIGISGGCTTNLMDIMEKNCLIKRIYNVKDRRMVTVEVTPKGKKLLKKFHEEFPEKEV
jgi:DNA-binding MarR family transcriptional regulator